jgi:hypothetical protein
MIIFACDFCGYIIRGSRIEKFGFHFCSSDCERRHINGETFNPNIPSHEIQKLETPSALQVQSTQDLRRVKKTPSSLF